jgi:hypothetical protein
MRTDAYGNVKRSTTGFDVEKPGTRAEPAPESRIRVVSERPLRTPGYSPAVPLGGSR